MAALAASNLGDSTLVASTLEPSVFGVTAFVLTTVDASAFVEATAGA